MKCFRITCLIIILCLIGNISVSGIAINNTTIKYDGSYLIRDPILDTLPSYKSPFRDSSNPSTEIYVAITSKYNQPRSIVNGTTPHIGVDLDRPTWNSTTRLVYPCTTGTNTNIPYSWALRYKTSGDQNKYIYYKHVKPTVASGVSITNLNVPIAKIGTPSENGGYSDEHLHLDLKSTSSDTMYDISYYFEHVDSWRYGWDMTLISNVYIAQNVLVCNAYVCSGNVTTTNRKECDKVELWYKKATQTKWNMVQMEFDVYSTLPDGTGVVWYYDLEALGNIGDTIQFYIGAYRKYDSGFTNLETHPWGLFPNKYAHPDINGNNYTPKFFSTKLVP
jgi:hypothetical protein